MKRVMAFMCAVLVFLGGITIPTMEVYASGEEKVYTFNDVTVVTEWGVADLRGKGPDERARLLIENCAHPDYRNLLWDYLKISKNGHVSHNVAAALALNTTYEREGDMRKIDWGKYL